MNSGAGIVRALILAALALLAMPADAQITVDSTASAQTDTATMSWSHTVGTGSNRLLVVGLADNVTGANQATSITYAGQNMTRQVLNGGGNPISEIWTLLAPPSGTAMIVVTFPIALDAVGGSVSFTGVDQTTPIRASSQARSSAQTNVTVSTSITSSVGDLVIDAVANTGPNAGGAAAAGQTERWNLLNPSSNFGGGSTKPGDAGSTTMTWNLSVNPGSAANGALAAISLMPAPPQADLAVTKSGPATIIAGNNISYNVTVTNNGPLDAQTVTLSDTLPAGTTFVSEAQTVGPAFTCTNPAVGATGSVSCTIATFASGASATFTLVFNVNANVAAGSTISNTASASSSTSDPTPGNNSQSASATVNQITTTGVTSSVNPSDFGQSVTFTATVTSNGGTPAGTVQFKDNGTNLGGLQTLNPSGVATFATSALTVGTHTITADYGGGTNFLASSGTLLNGQVVRAQPSLTINDVSLTEGDSGTKNFIFTVTQSAASNLEVKVDFATADGTATIADSDYQSNSGTLTFNPGDLTKTITVLVNGDQKFEPDETFFVNLTNPINATIGDNQGLGTITNDDAMGGIIRFSSATYNTTESSGSTTITVERVGDTTQAVTVDYTTPDDSGATTVVSCATINGVASPRCDFTTALGTLKFAAGEGSKTFTVLISQDNFVEGPESLTLTLSNPTGGTAFAAPTTATLTIADDATEPAANPIDDANNFVRQHYHDFLNREPDAGGIGFWTNQITSCGTDAQCIESKRVNVSAAFYLSIEFQNTGYLVERLYKASYADATGTSLIGGAHQLTIPIVKFSEFLPDTQTIAQGLVVGQTGWETVLENNKQAFTAEFVTRSRFTTAYANTLTPAQFVDMLFANAGVVPTSTERQAAIDEFGGAATSANAAARGRALRRVAENSTLAQQEFNRAFVLIEYFGYLRRNPNAAPDSDFSGYDFWLTKLNNFTQPGDDVLVPIQKAEMVKAFINSSEYRQRFGP